MTTLLTERLELRPLCDADGDDLAELNADDEVMRYIRFGRGLTREESDESTARMVGAWDEHGFGLFAVRVRETGAFLGWAGLAVPGFLPEVMPAVEIGWRLRRDAWGHGYATEAATAALRFGFDVIGLDRIVSIRHVDNVRSGRVMEKLGFRHEFDTVVPLHDQPVSVYALDRERQAG